MPLKKPAIIAASVATLAGLAVSHLYLKRLEAEVSGGPKVSVLVVSEDTPIGAVLTEDKLAVREVPQAYVEERNVRASEVKRVLGVRVAGGLRANEAVLWSDLMKFSEHGRVLSGLVQNGLRAVTVDARAADFDGLLRPGDRVDVLFTTPSKDTEGGATTTLLQNLLVLSVGSDLGKRDDGNKDDIASGRTGSVTLSATLEQAQLLTQAKERGRLGLTLRNPDDIQLVEGVPETGAKDVLAAKDRLEWRKPGAVRGKAIDHVQ
jgi:pilus assembly protein CpaB